MRDTLRRLLDAGVGAVMVTRERAEALVDDLVQRGEVGREERESLISRLVERGQAERAALADAVAERVARMVRLQPFATKQDLAEMEARLRSDILAALGRTPSDGNAGTP